MSTKKLGIGRYLVLVMAVVALQVLSAGAPAAPATRVAKSVSASKSKMTISLNHRLRRGHLIVSLDNTPIFNEEFVKAALAISQTTTWDPVTVPAGTHRLTARVNGTNGKAYLSATYDLKLGRAKGIEVHLTLKGDKLTIEPTS